MNIDPFKDAPNVQNDLETSELAKNAGDVNEADNDINYDAPLAENTTEEVKENLEKTCDSRCPENHGEWEGERGNSKWVPEGDYVPPEKSPEGNKPYSNPDQLSWKDSMGIPLWMDIRTLVRFPREQLKLKVLKLVEVTQKIEISGRQILN